MRPTSRTSFIGSPELSVSPQNELSYAAPGKQYPETVSVPLRGLRRVPIRVIDAGAPVRLITEGDLPLLLPRMEIEFRYRGPSSCDVCWRMLSRNESVLVRCVVLPVAGWLMRRRAIAGLRNLKSLLEGSPPTSAPGRDS